MIWIESVIEKHSHSRIEYMIKVRVYPVRSVSLGDRAVTGDRAQSLLLCVFPSRAFGAEF